MLFLIPIAAIGIAIHLYSTSLGAGVSPDSTRYITAANSLNDGVGLQILAPDGGLEPLTLWSPLYPVILSIFGQIGIDIYDAARILNALMMGANVLLIGVMIARLTPGSWIAPLVGSSVLLISVDVISVHAWALTEPTAIFLGFLGLLLLDLFLIDNKILFFLTSALCLGLALITRYAAFPFVAAGIMSLIIYHRGERLGKKLAMSSAYIALSIFPMMVWIYRNLSLTGSSINRTIRLRGGALKQLEAGLFVVSDWILPGRISGEIREWIAVGFLLGWLIAAIIYGKLRFKSGIEPAQTIRVSYFSQILVFFVLCYSFMLIVGKFFLEPSFPINSRVFVLPYIAIVIVCVGMAYWAHWKVRYLAQQRIIGGRLWWEYLVYLLLLSTVIWAGFKIVHTVKWVEHAHQDSKGYASQAWSASPEINFIKDLPKGTLIYSNGSDAILFLTGRATKLLPGEVKDERSPSDAELKPVEEMESDLRNHGGYIVYFRGITWRRTLGEGQLQRFLELDSVFGTESGSIFTLTEVKQ
jgi:hypothetical protein